MSKKSSALFLIAFAGLLLTACSSAYAKSPWEILQEYSVPGTVVSSHTLSAGDNSHASETADDFIVGYYIEPSTNPIETIDFDELKKIGITDIYVRATTNGCAGVIYTKLPQWKTRAEAAGLRIHAWVWDGFCGSYAKAVADMGINLLIDMETYDMASKLSQLADIRANTRGKIFTVCCKGEGIDGSQKYPEVSKYCDYISPMLYRGDYSLSLDKMRSFAKTHGEKYPIIMSLETYESDRNPVPKSNSSILAEIEAVRPYCKGVILFRYGNVSRFTGGVPKSTSSTASTGRTSVTDTSTSKTTLKQVPQNDTTQNKSLVKALQKALQANGFYRDLPIDGWFGPQTREAVEAYQKDNGLNITGMADVSLRKRLHKKTSSSSSKTSSSASGDIQAKIDKIGKEEAEFEDRQNVCSDGDTMARLGYGDCWADAEWLYDKLSAAGVQVRIMAYRGGGTGVGYRHTWIEINTGNGWKEWPYKKYNSQHFGDVNCGTPSVLIGPGHKNADILSTGY